jgi:hypothetical protein
MPDRPDLAIFDVAQWGALYRRLAELAVSDRPYVLVEEKPARWWRPGGSWSLWYQPKINMQPKRVADRLRRGSAMSLRALLNTREVSTHG